MVGESRANALTLASVSSEYTQRMHMLHEHSLTIP